MQNRVTIALGVLLACICSAWATHYDMMASSTSKIYRNFPNRPAVIIHMIESVNCDGSPGEVREVRSSKVITEVRYERREGPWQFEVGNFHFSYTYSRCSRNLTSQSDSTSNFHLFKKKEDQKRIIRHDFAKTFSKTAPKIRFFKTPFFSIIERFRRFPKNFL